MKFHHYRRILQALVGLAFLMPLFVGLDSYIFPFIVPKVLYLRVIVALIAVVWVMFLAGYWKEIRSRVSLIGLSVALFFISLTLSTLFSVDVQRSLWDNHERMLGLYTMFHYAILFYVARQVFVGWREWRWLLGWFFVAAIPVMVIAWIQVADPQFLLNQGSNRVRSTLGNTIYVAGYSIFLFFVSAVLLFEKRQWWWRLLWALGAFGSLLTLIFTQTRGSWLGFAIGGVLLLLLVGVAKECSARWRKIALVGFGVLVLAGGTIFGLRNQSVITENPFLSRFTHISFTEGTGRTRVMAWQIAYETWKEHPIVGWGINTFFYAFNQGYNPEFFRFGISETWFDNAHNVLVNTLTTQGVIGAVAYLLLFIAGLYGAQRLRRRHPELWYVAIGTQVFLVATFVHNLFVFENTTSYLYFFVVLAMIDQLSNRSDEPVQPARAPWKNQAIAGVIVLVLATLLTQQYVGKVSSANKALRLGIGLLHNGQYADSLRVYEEAKSIGSPHFDDIVREYSRAVAQVINTRQPEVIGAWHDIFYPLAITDMKTVIDVMPFELRMYLVLAQMAQQSGLHTNTPELLLQAQAALKKALELSPKRQQLGFELAQAHLLLNQFGQAEQVLQKVIDDYPQIAEVHWRLGTMYIAAEQPEQAVAAFREAVQYDLGEFLPPRWPIADLIIETLRNAGEEELAQQYQDAKKDS